MSPAEAVALRFTHRALDERTVRLGYALLGRNGTRIELEETLDLPDSLGPLASRDDPAVARTLLGLHLAAGTSYWKTCIPEDLVLEDPVLSDEDASFWTDVYTRGMGEFFFKNGIDPTGRVRFRAGGPDRPASAPAAMRPPLLLWGGGKDSVVSHEILARAGEPHDLLTIGRGRWAWVSRSASVAGVPHHLLERRLDPKLFEMNADGALNGKYSAIIWDLNLAKKIIEKGHTAAELFFTAHNLFNGAQYLDGLFPNPRRWFEGGVRVKV